MTGGPDFYNRRKGFDIKPPAPPEGMKIESRIGVQAPADVVWDILQDVAAWPDWNPIYPKASGVVRIGERLTYARAMPGRPHDQFQATVLDWTPNELLHVRRAVMGGLVPVIQYWEIDTLAEENCVFSSGELYAGWLGRSAAQSLRRALRRGFEAEGEALKARAEAAWRERRGAPKSQA